MLTEALILAGGFATRLGEVAKETPKPLLPIAGKPFLEYLLWNLKRQGIERVVVSTGHLAERIEEEIGNGVKFGLSIAYSQESEPLGTGGAIKLGAKLLGERFLALNGDTLFDFNLPALSNLATAPGEAAIALRTVPDTSRYGTALLEGDRIASFAEKRQAGPGPISGGAYILTQGALAELPDGPSSIERDLFPALASRQLLKGHVFPGFFIDIGVPEDLHRAQEAIPAWRRMPAILLDRDGVLNVNHGYVCEPERFEWTPNAREAIRWLNDAGYLAIIITNQAGIGRGYYTDAQFQGFMRWIQTQLMEVGAHFDAYYYCPHHPTEAKPPFDLECDCRKPKPGMLLQAMREWEIQPGQAAMIGDKDSDIQAATAAGIASAKYEGGDLLAAVQRVASLLPSPKRLFP